VGRAVLSDCRTLELGSTSTVESYHYEAGNCVEDKRTQAFAKVCPTSASEGSDETAYFGLGEVEVSSG
jgi:hypothetical protein